MSFEIYDFFSVFFSTFFCGASVKLADDYLDAEKDEISNCFNFYTQFGKGSLIYAMLFLVLSAAFNVIIGMSLFISCYIIGMFYDLKTVFPSHCSGLQESLLCLSIGGAFWGFKVMLFSICLVFSIQLIDDFLDIHLDKLAKHRNLIQTIGKYECLLLLSITLLSAYYCNPSTFFPVIIASFILYGLILYFQRGKKS